MIKNKIVKTLIVLIFCNVVILSLLYQFSIVLAWEIDKTGHVDYIIDGDTFDLTTDERIRLADIDTPELGDPGADEATAYLTSLIYEKDVFIDVDDLYGTGPYGRTIAVVYIRVDETYLKNVNKALLDEGHAIVKDYDNEFNPNDWTLLVEYPENPPPEEPTEEPPEEPTITTVLTVTSPISSDRWYEGNTYTIEWSSEGIINYVDIDLFKGNTLITSIVESTENDGEYEWVISTSENYKGTNYRIRVSDSSDSTIEDYSSYFSINYAAISISTPNLSSNFRPGEICTITWNSVGFIEDVSIELYRGSVFIEYITASTENDGLYEWTVGNYETGADYCIYIKDIQDSEIFDRCQFFTIENPYIPMIIFGVIIAIIVSTLVVGGFLYVYLVKFRTNSKRKTLSQLTFQPTKPKEVTVIAKSIPEKVDLSFLEKHINLEMKIHEGKLSNLDRKEYLWQEKPVVYYLCKLEKVKLSELNQGIESSKELDSMLIRISEKAYEYKNPKVGEIISCKGILRNDKFDGLILKNVFLS